MPPLPSSFSPSPASSSLRSPPSIATRLRSSLHRAAELLRRTRGNGVGVAPHHRRGGQIESVSGLLGRIVAVIAVVIVCYLLAKLFYANLEQYPPLLTKPIQGADIAPYPPPSAFERRRRTMVLDKNMRPTGLSLPYRKNSLVLLPSRVTMPRIESNNRLSVSFWVKPENMAQRYASTTKTDARGQNAYLLAMNETNEGGETDYEMAFLYDGSRNEIVLRVRVSVVNSDTNDEYQDFHISNALALQRYQMVTVVLDNRHMDLYVNDRMLRSVVLANVPNLSSRAQWVLYPGTIPFSGTITCVRYFGYALNYQEVRRLHARQRHKELPAMSFLGWWTWIPSNSLTRLIYGG